MMGAAYRGVLGIFAGVCVVGMAGAAFAVDAEAGAKLTDRDRIVRNFTREAAVVDHNQIRLEVRGMRAIEEVEDRGPSVAGSCQGSKAPNCTRLNLLGQRVKGVESLNGGIIELLVSYGLAPNTEIGLIVPGYIETVNRDDGSSETGEDIGDITLYGKFKYAVHEMVSVGGGLELTPPTGPDDKIVTVRSAANPRLQDGTVSGFGTGHLGINPFVSARFAWKSLGVESHLGYNFYSSDHVERVFNSSAAVIVRVTESVALRAEFSQRVWDQFGSRWVDAVVLPGIDVYLTDSITVRPTGLANISGAALDWGFGLGVAAAF